jgi:hypothetical protein
MNKILEKLNKELNEGRVPDELNFNKQTPENDDASYWFDWSKVQYNTFYKDKRYIESKFPKGHEAIPGFDKIFEIMAQDISSPLEEMLKITEDETQSLRAFGHIDQQ